jgi:hypothetical protein
MGAYGSMPTRHPRIQVTEDRELSAALRSAAPYLPAGLSPSRQLRELAIIGARYLSDEGRSQELLKELARSFEQAETAGIDWELLRDGKLLAWSLAR